MARTTGDNSTLTNKLATRAHGGQTTGPSFRDLIEKMKPQIQAALPKHVSVDRVARIALTTYNSNPLLRQCDQTSLLASIMVSSQLGVEVNTPLGQAYIIPYFNKKRGVYEAQFQLGYKGLLDLAYRSGEYQVIYAMEVYQNDDFEYEYGLDPYLKHKPAEESQGEPIYYYAAFKTQNGGANFRVWSRKKIEKHSKKYSQAVQKGWTSPWKTDFDAMAKKTVLKDLLKYAPLSIEMQRHMSNDEMVKHDIAEDMSDVQGEYIDVDFSYRNDEEEPGSNEDIDDKPEGNKTVDGAELPFQV